MPIRADYVHKESPRVPLISKIGLALFLATVLWGYADLMWPDVVGQTSLFVTKPHIADVVFECMRGREGNWRWLPNNPHVRVIADPDGFCPESGLILSTDLPREEILYYKKLIDQASTQMLLPRGEQLAHFDH